MAMAGVSTGEKYDVFLSFRGPDTRESFTDCLFEFLKEAGLRVFMDDEELRVGESIGREIQKSIYDSKLFVPVFSKGFAYSKWCLKEIAWMDDCMEEFPGKKEMLPIFFEVDARDVKLKTDLYANALLEHEKTSGCETVQRWRKALIKVPEVKGWNRRDTNGQGKLIRRITQNISHRLKLKHRILPDHFIGYEDQVQHIMNALDNGSRDVRIVVIHGMGGIGKTTLVSAVFNKKCCQFQGCSFLSNVRESVAGNGILSLQNKLMRDMLRFSFSNFCDENDAMNCIQGSLRNKDVLVVLDDVSDMDQIRKLVGMGDWVGLGSRVIITTRNLSCVANVEEIENNQGKKIFIYEMRELGFDNSLQLLCWHAFGQHVPPPGYEQHSHDILSFTKGIPLAIEVIGSYLRRKSPGIWKEMLNKLRKIPHARLYQEILMTSYETLCDEEKEIFLDIAFYLAGHDKASAFHFWEACELSPEMSFDTLVSYALVKTYDSNEFWMHDLLKDLGREVVRKESNGNLGMRSRLCNEDAKLLLLKREGTKHVKALKLDSNHACNVTPAELSGLSGLRFLELCGGNFVGDFKDCCLSELRWVSWKDCALDFRGTHFDNLVVLKLSMGNMNDARAGWEQLRTARNLKVLEIQCLNFTATPDLSSFLSLERLTFRRCESLAHIDPSIGNLEYLKSLKIINDICKPPYHHPGSELPSSICNMKALSRLVINSINLKQLPENIGELKGLKFMKITKCEFLRTLPDSIGDLESLIDLDLYGDGITELPESIGKLRNLTVLNVRSNRLRRLPATIGDLDKLELLDASDNEALQGVIPDEFGKLRSLTSLNLSSTGICGLPSCMVLLACLHSLHLSSCNVIEELPELPTSLTWLEISYRRPKAILGQSRFHLPSSICNMKALSRLGIHRINLKQLPENIGELKGLKFMNITECEFLRTLPDSIGDLESLIDLNLSGDGITELPESIGKLRNLTKLNVSKNQLRRLPATIGDLDRLVELDASYNEDLQGIPDEFGKLRSLTSLNLSLRGICGLPSCMVLLGYLHSLYLNSCNVIQELPTSLTGLDISCRWPKAILGQSRFHLPSSICNMKALSRLGIHCINLKQLPENIGELKGLKFMKISECEFLRTLPDSIGDLESLIDLDLSGDGITELPESIGKLRNLSYLNVSKNQLRRLPATIGDLDRLVELDASYNEALQGVIPDEFGKLRSLTSLNLSWTGICGLPSCMVLLACLHSLYLNSCNVIQELPTSLTMLDISYWWPKAIPGQSRFHLPSSICNLKALSRLKCHRIKLNQLPENIGELKCLEFMKITECEFLRTLPDSIGDLDSLIHLDLSGDGITELPESIGKLRNLTVLNVRSNRLRRLPATIGDLDKLELLDASYNEDLQGIPDEFGKLRSLASLNLSSTGICGLPSCMVLLACLDCLYLHSWNVIQELPELPTSLTMLDISYRWLKAVPNLSSLTNLVDLSLLNGGNHDDYGHNHQVPPYLHDRLDQLSPFRDLQFARPNPSLLSLLPSGLKLLSLYDFSTSLSCWECLSYLRRLRRLSLHESIASEIRLDGLESLMNLTYLEIVNCVFLERVHDISRLRKLWSLKLFNCPELVEIGGLAQPPESLLYLGIHNCDSIRGLPRLSDTKIPGLKAIERS